MLGEVLTVSARELRRNLRSAKGLVATLLFSLGGVASVLVYRAGADFLSDATPGQVTPEDLRPLRVRAMLALFDNDRTVAEYLADAPSVLLVFYKMTLLFLPLLIILLGYDTLAGDLQHRTLRYSAGRARRESIVVGKALALWVTVAGVSLAPSVFAWGSVVANGAAPLATALTYGLHFWVMAVFFASAYAGLTTLVSSFFRTPIVALLSSVATAFVLFVLRTVLASDLAPAGVRALRYAFPGAWETRMMSPRPAHFGAGMLACFAFMAVCTALACVSLRKRDL